MRTGALKPSTFKNPVGKKKGGEESYRLCHCQAARERKGGVKEEGEAKNTRPNERNCYTPTKILETESQLKNKRASCPSSYLACSRTHQV